MGDIGDLLSAFRHLTGEKENICRLCFDAVDTGVSLDESRLVECFYYDDTVTFAQMLTDLGAPGDRALPHILCEYCADLAMKAFLFKKLSQYSFGKWHEAIDRFNQALDLESTICAGVKTAYFLIEKETTRIVTIWKTSNEKTKETVAEKITKIIKRRRNETKTTLCQVCGEEVIYGKLSVHMKKKHYNKQCACLNCKKTFKDPFHLRDHEERVHRRKTIPCSKCEKKFSTERLVRLHDLQSHIAVTCKHCSEQLPSREALAVHSKKHKLFKCLRCYKIYKKRLNFTDHTKICRDVPEYVFCDICNKSFNTKQLLRNHMAIEHGFGSVHSCKWCNKRFSNRSKLKLHIVKHTRERSFTCEQCGGVFVTNFALKYHIRLHTGEKPFSCDVCGEKFLSASRRMDHKRRKHMEPQHVCSICDSKFYSKFSLNKHFVRHKNPLSKLFISNIIN